jgi:hypothetical protein
MASTPETTSFTVEIVDLPTHWAEQGRIRLLWQSGIRPVEYTEIEGSQVRITVGLKDGRWTGKSVGRNPDGRRFVYLAWINSAGTSFRRIKLYQDQVQGDRVRILGAMKDGSPACSTARLAE